MSAGKKIETRYIYVKNAELTTTGFTTYERAKWAVAGLPPEIKAPEYRVKIALRNRTNTFDVVVKKRTEVKQPPTANQIKDAKDTAFMAQHALTGE